MMLRLNDVDKIHSDTHNMYRMSVLTLTLNTQLRLIFSICALFLLLFCLCSGSPLSTLNSFLDMHAIRFTVSQQIICKSFGKGIKQRQKAFITCEDRDV